MSRSVIVGVRRWLVLTSVAWVVLFGLGGGVAAFWHSRPVMLLTDPPVTVLVAGPEVACGAETVWDLDSHCHVECKEGQRAVSISAKLIRCACPERQEKKR